MYCYQDQANFEIALHFAQIDNKIIRLNIVSTLPNINELRDRSSCLYPSQTLMNYAIDRLDRPESKKERNCSPTERAYSDLRLGETVHAVIHFFNNLGTAILNSDFSIIPEQLGDLAQSLDFLAFTLLPLHIISSYLSTGEFFSPFHHTSGVCAVILSKFNKAEISADLKILLLSMRQTQQRMEEEHAKFLINPPLPPPPHPLHRPQHRCQCYIQTPPPHPSSKDSCCPLFPPLEVVLPQRNFPTTKFSDCNRAISLVRPQPQVQIHACGRPQVAPCLFRAHCGIAHRRSEQGAVQRYKGHRPELLEDGAVSQPTAI